MTSQQLLTFLKGVDLHCLPPTGTGAASPFVGGVTGVFAGCETGVPAGVRDRVDDPPRRR